MLSIIMCKYVYYRFHHQKHKQAWQWHQQVPVRAPAHITYNKLIILDLAKIDIYVGGCNILFILLSAFSLPFQAQKDLDDLC